MSDLCMSRAAARVCVRVLSPLQQFKKGSSYMRAEEETELTHEIDDLSFNGYLPESECSDRVMVVVDSNHEAEGALEWALSHAVQSQDTVILLHVARKDGKTNVQIDQTTYDLLQATKRMCQLRRPEVMFHVPDGKANVQIDQTTFDLLQATKRMCQLRRPEVHVEIAIREGKEKGAIIVEAAEQLSASLLVLGQQKQSLLWDLWTWMRKRSQSGVVDYCIQNANCMTIAVRRKNQKYGGYLITTKRHKNFWLLA